MNAIRTLVVGTILLGVAAIAGGCGDDSPTGSVSPSPLVRVSPMDGEERVATAGWIHMAFNETVDTASFHEWFLCIDSTSHDALQDSLRRGMMGMGGMHSDSMAFFGRMHERDIDGMFHWNNDGDSCSFMPDSAFMPHTEYVLHFRNEMRNHNGGRMRHMDGTFSTDLTFRFRTQ